MLDDLQLDQIADPQLREVMRRLMNLVEQLNAENQHLREENQRLRDENNRLRGQQGRPKVDAKRPDPVKHSSKAERRLPRGRMKQAKNPTIPIPCPARAASWKTASKGRGCVGLMGTTEACPAAGANTVGRA